VPKEKPLFSATFRGKPNADGFYSVDNIKPNPMDLCHLVDSNGRIRPGWYVNKNHWDGFKIEELGDIVAWKPMSRGEYND